MLTRAGATVGAVVGAALVVLAVSELVFANEGPVRDVVGSPSPLAALGIVGEMLLFYLVPALLLVALDRHMRTWTRVLLAGAFVGWSIESALVPVAYEAVPFSYVWPSVSWHALVDVAVGYVGLRVAMRARWPVAVAAAVGFGTFWGLWATWTWDAGLRLSTGEFAALAALVAGMLTLGYLLVDVLGSRAAAGRWLLLAAVAVTGVLWLVVASALVVPALGLLALAAVSAVALVGAPAGARPSPLRLPPPPPASYLVPSLAAAVAAAGYALWSTVGAPVPGEDLVWPLAFGGAAVFAVALVRGLVRGLVPARTARTARTASIRRSSSSDVSAVSNRTAATTASAHAARP